MIAHIVELLLVLLVYGIPVTVSTIRYHRTDTGDLAKYSFRHLAYSLIRPTLIILLILYIASRQDQKLLSIGLDFSTAGDLVAGAALFIPAFFLFAMARKLPGLRQQYEVDPPKYVRLELSCKTWCQRSLRVASVTAGAIDQELFFRGYLILLWGARTGATGACAVVSAILFGASHIYQGRRAPVWHLVSAALLTAPVLITGSLMMSIGLHVTWNLMTTLAQWRHSDWQTRTNASEPDERAIRALACYLVFCVIVLFWQGKRLASFIDGLLFEGASSLAFVVCCVAVVWQGFKVRREKRGQTPVLQCDGTYGPPKPPVPLSGWAMAALILSVVGLPAVMYVEHLLSPGPELELWPTLIPYGTYLALIIPLGVCTIRKIRRSNGRLSGTLLAAGAITISLVPAIPRLLLGGVILFVQLVAWIISLVLS